MSNFIEHNDPTKPISTNVIGSNYNYLNDNEKIIIGSKLLGMDHIPVDIQTFINDDYFLGHPNITNKGRVMFEYWRDKLDKIFPTPINTNYPYISFGGCIGSGKSYLSKIIGLYYYHRLDCCSNIFASLGLGGGSKIAFGFFHANYDTAYEDFVKFYKYVFVFSPYFKNLYNRPPIRLIASGPKSTGSVIGTQLVYTVLSEIGFWRPQDAINKINEVNIRYKTRFEDKRYNFGGIICDSSAHDEDMGASKKFEESFDSKDVFKTSPSHWQVRPEKYVESGGRTFRVYRGDSKISPRVLGEGEEIPVDWDRDRVIEVPIQLKLNFLTDIVRSLNDLAGIPYTSKDLFFNGDISHVLNCGKIPNRIPDVIEDIDFYDLNDTIYDRCEPMLDLIPKHTSIFLHLDIGLKKDICGCSICYFDGESTDSDGTTYPRFKFPLVVGLGRKKGQSTSLDHILQFIKKLTTKYIVHVSADSFASAGLFQSCERWSIEYSCVSIDKTTDAAFMFKNVVNTERCIYPENDRVFRECSELRIVTNGIKGTHVKVDHPLVSKCYSFDYKNRKKDEALPGTKDLVDSMMGALWSCYKKYSEYLEDGPGGAMRQLKVLKNVTQTLENDTSKRFQNMLEDIF